MPTTKMDKLTGQSVVGWSAVITSTGQMVSCHNLDSSDSVSLSSLRHWYEGGSCSLDHVEAAPRPTPGALLYCFVNETQWLRVDSESTAQVQTPQRRPNHTTS